MSFDKVVDSDFLDSGLHQIADAIRGKGGVSGKLEFPTAMAKAITDIETGIDTSDATATAGHILNGETAYVNGEKIIGNIPIRDNTDLGFSSPNFIVKKGYYRNDYIYTVSAAQDPNISISVSPEGLLTVDVDMMAAYYDAKTITKTIQLSGYTGNNAVWSDGISNPAAGGLSANGIIRYVTFVNHDGTVEYGRKSVIVGENCVDPVVSGLLDTPTRESTAQYDYTFSGGWATTPGGGIDSNALKAVTEDRTVYANFISAVRYYTITYFDSDGVTVLKTERLAYGATPSYSPEKDGCSFSGWYPTLSAVMGDAIYTAQWIESAAFADTSWETIAARSADGTASSMWSVGDTKTFTCNGYTLEAQIAGFGLDTLADGTGKAGISLVIVEPYPTKQKYHSVGNNTTWFSWDVCDLRTYCNSTIFGGIQEDLRSVIKPVTKKSVYKDYYTTVTTTDKCWILSQYEVGTTSIANGNIAYSELFKDNNSRIRKKYNSAVGWVLRDLSGTKLAYAVSALGKASTATTTNEQYVLFGFCI